MCVSFFLPIVLSDMRVSYFLPTVLSGICNSIFFQQCCHICVSYAPEVNHIHRYAHHNNGEYKRVSNSFQCPWCLNVFSPLALKAYRGRRGVAPAKNPGTHCIGGRVGLRGGTDVLEKILLLLPGFEPRTAQLPYLLRCLNVTM